MTDEQIINALREVAKKYEGKPVATFETNISNMATDAADHIERLCDEINRQKAEIERLTDLINEIAEANEDLVRDNHDLYVSLKKRDAEIERLKGMVSQNEGVLPEYEKLITSKAIREFAEKIDQLLNRYSNLHKYADKARRSTEEYDDGTLMEMVSVWEVLSLEKWEMVDYETMSELQGNIETIAKERLLSGLERDFRLLVKEMTEGQL